jgi:hypothetical protein
MVSLTSPLALSLSLGRLCSPSGYMNGPAELKLCAEGFRYRRGAQDSCTRAVHCASVRIGCVEPAAPTIPWQADHLSLSLRVRSPSPPIADAALPSPATCRAVPSRARVQGTAVRIIAHCALCTACATLRYRKDERAKPRNLLTKWRYLSPPPSPTPIKRLSLLSWLFIFICSSSLFVCYCMMLSEVGLYNV